MSAITLTMQPIETGSRVIVAGELDMSTVPTLAKCLAELDGEVTLDCADLAFMDSRAIDLFIQTHHRLSDDGGGFVLENLAPNCLRVLELMDLDAVLDLR
jgi:anti-anti-sigma factor